MLISGIIRKSVLEKTLLDKKWRYISSVYSQHQKQKIHQGPNNILKAIFGEGTLKGRNKENSDFSSPCNIIFPLIFIAMNIEPFSWMEYVQIPKNVTFQEQNSSNYTRYQITCDKRRERIRLVSTMAIPYLCRLTRMVDRIRSGRV